MLHLSFAVEILFMLSFPIALGLLLRRRLGVGWGLFGAGALAFIGAQAVRQPLLIGLTRAFQRNLLPQPVPQEQSFAFNVSVLALTAGLFEEGARYLVYRLLIRKARSWRQALMFGAGHGGVESILLGLGVAVTLANMVVLRGMDPSRLPVPPEQQAQVAEQVAAFWATPWYLPLLGGVERLFAIVLHIALAVLVLQVFLRGQWRYLALAMGYHALANLIGAGINRAWGPVAAEGVLLLVALLSLWIVRRYRPGAGEGET